MLATRVENHRHSLNSKFNRELLALVCSEWAVRGIQED